jgi:hypothetical protein
MTEGLKFLLILLGISLLFIGWRLHPSPWRWVPNLAAVAVFLWLQFLWGWTVGSIIGAVVVILIVISQGKKFFSKGHTS